MPYSIKSRPWMNDAMTRMLVTMDKLEMRMLESAEKLDAPIHFVDGMVRPPRRPMNTWFETSSPGHRLRL